MYTVSIYQFLKIRIYRKLKLIHTFEHFSAMTGLGEIGIQLLLYSVRHFLQLYELLIQNQLKPFLARTENQVYYTFK